MPYERPSLPELISRVQTDFENELNNSASRQPGTFEYTSSIANAGLAHSIHGHVAEIGRNLFPDVANEEFLLIWANIYGIPRTQPSAATFNVQFTGVPATAIPINTQVQSQSGVIYETTVASAIGAAGDVTINVEATADFLGTQGNVYGGTIVSLVTPIPGVNSDAVVIGAPTQLVGGGAGLETIESLRARVLERMRSQNISGSAGYYENFAKENAAVTRAWERPNFYGVPDIAVFIVQDIYNADGTLDQTVDPGPAVIADVQAALDAVVIIPATITVEAPNLIPINPSIQLEPNTADVQQAVENQLQDLILRRTAPGGSLTAGGTIPLSQINEAISLAQGETDHNLVSPVSDLVTAAGANEIYVLGTITFADLP